MSTGADPHAISRNRRCRNQPLCAGHHGARGGSAI